MLLYNFEYQDTFGYEDDKMDEIGFGLYHMCRSYNSNSSSH